MTALFDPTTAVVLSHRADRAASLLDADSWPKYLTIAGLGSHGLGFVVVNMYLLRYGVSESDLFGGRYAFAGAVLLLTLALATVIPLVAWRLTVLYARDRATRRRDWMAMIVCAAGLLAGSVQFFSALLGSDVAGAVILFGLAAITGLGVMRLARAVADPVWLLRKPRPGVPNAQLTGMTKFAMRATIALMAVLILCLYVSAYAGVVFPNLSESIGGGRGPQTSLVVDGPGAAALRAAGVEMTGADGNVTPPVRIAFSGSRIYVLDVPGSARDVILDKDRVMGSF